MSDGEDKRRATRNWREYKEEMRESYRVYAWVWRELVSIEAKQWYKKMSVALVVEVSLALSVPFAVSLVINGLVQHDYKKVAVALVAVFSALALERVAAHFVMVYREWILGINYGTLDKRTSELFFEKSMGQHQQENSSLSASNVEKGRGRVIELQNMMLFEGEHTLIILAVSFALLWLITPVAGMVMTLMMLIIIAWSMFMNQRVSETMAPVDKEMRALNRYRVERWDQVARVKSNAKEVEEVTTIVDWFNRIVLADRTFWLWYIKNLTGRGILTVVALVCSLLYGVWLVWNGVWEVGLLYPLFTWASNVKDTVWRIGHIEHQLNWNMPSVRSLMEALSIVPDVVDVEGAVDVPCNKPITLEIDNVTHGYCSSGIPILRGVSLSVAAGESVALIGPSGCGKSTLTRLVMRNSDPDKGSIRVCGQDLRDVRLASWLQKVGHIAQDASVLDGTIRYNLLYALPNGKHRPVSDEELWKQMQSLEIDFGERLNDGLETKVGKNGMKLSGGEKQRVMIGSAVMKQPRFMVIDEATSSLDAVTERKVHDGLKEILKDDIGALIITHRLSTVRDICDRFVVMRPVKDLHNGDPQIEAVAGSFEELYNISETFRQLADEQGVVIYA